MVKRYVVTLANRKGGVGKSATAVSLAAALKEIGQPVLLVDMDPAAGSLFAIGQRPDLLRVTAAASAVRLGRELPEAGFAVVDTPPADSAACTAALEVSDLVLAPVPGSILAMMNAALMADRLAELDRRPALKFLLTMFQEARPACRAVAEELERAFPGQLCRTRIPFSAYVERAMATHRSVLEVAPSSAVSAAFLALAREVVRYATKG